jgi:hypothetical protein
MIKIRIVNNNFIYLFKIMILYNFIIIYESIYTEENILFE